MGSLAKMNGDRSAAQSIRHSFDSVTIPPMVSGILGAPGLIRAPTLLIRIRQADVDRDEPVVRDYREWIGESQRGRFGIGCCGSRVGVAVECGIGATGRKKG